MKAGAAIFGAVALVALLTVAVSWMDGYTATTELVVGISAAVVALGCAAGAWVIGRENDLTASDGPQDA